MHRALVVALSVLVLGLLAPVTPARAGLETKVVVVVGPAGSSTAHYKDDARQIVAEARRYTSNVVKVFTPRATWAQVKAAAQDASILVYLGHGNGWPSRYAPFQTLTKNGFGVDPSTGADSTRTVYYGEEYIRRDIRLAPNAVVLLYHLCYASGNTEPGLPVGSFADSRERVDNYGAGFLGAGARAVIAEGHPAHPVTDAIRQLFTTNRTIEQVFRNAPTFHDHVVGPFDAQRTPGMAYLLDPDSAAPSGFYRSVIGDLSLRATAVVAPGLESTDADPDELVIPGAAEVIDPAGAGLWPKPGAAADPDAAPPEMLAKGTRLRLLDGAGPGPDGSRILVVRVLGGSATGFVRSTALAPRDSTPVRALTLDQSAPWLSPNDDGTNDALVVTARFSERATAVLKVRNAAGKVVRTLSSSGTIARFEWSLRASGGGPVPDGDYTWTMRAVDAWGNAAYATDGRFAVDGTAPVTTAATDAQAGAGGWLVSPPTVALVARDRASGVRSIAVRVNRGPVTTYRRPVTVTDQGTVTVRYRATDKSGIRERWRTLTLRIDTIGPSVAFPMTGKAGDVPDTWLGKVAVSPVVRDATSGIARARIRVDGARSVPLGTDPVVVKGNGEHLVTVVATDRAGNRTRATASFRIDSTRPTVAVGPAGDVIPTVTPNDDGIDEVVDLPITASEPGSLTAVITDPRARTVRTLTRVAVAGTSMLSWDGRDDRGTPVKDGRYTVAIVARDVAGNESRPATAEVDVYAALAGLSRDAARFFPQDGDRLARRVRAGWTLVSPAAVSIEVVDANGRVVRHGPDARAYPAGTATWTWNGRNDAGAFVPRGAYRIEVRATNGTQQAVQHATVRADAYLLSSSLTAAVRGRSLVLTAVSVEPLAAAPRLIVRQPGLDPRTVIMTRQGPARWTATITPRRRGAAGTLSLVVKGTDTGGGRNTGVLRLPLE